MNIEKLRKLQSFIKENDIKDDTLVEKIMNINIDKPNTRKAYWESINGKCFKKKLNEVFIELTHIKSVDILSDDDVRVIVDRYMFKAYCQNITLNSNENIYLSNLNKDRYDGYTEITKEEYNDTVFKLKDLAEKSKALFSQL